MYGASTALAVTIPPLQLTTEEQQWLDAHPQITLGITSDFQPDLVINADGHYSGLIIDFIDYLNQQLGDRLHLHIEQDWNRITTQAIERDLDGLATSSPNPTWDQHFLYTNPLYKGFFYLYCLSDAQPLTSLTDLVGRRVGYLAGMKKVHHFLTEQAAIDAIPFANNEAMVQALLDGRVDALVSIIDLEWWRRQHNLPAFRVTGLLADSQHEVVMSIRNDWPILVRILNKALNNIPIEIQEQIRDHWLTVSNLPAGTPSIPLTPAEQAWLQAHPNIVLGVSDQWPPSVMRDQHGRLSGLFVDFVTLINTRLNTKIELRVHSSWQHISQEAIAGHIDGLFAVAVNLPIWQQHFQMTDSYLSTFLYFFIRDEETLSGTDVTALFGKRVGILEGMQQAQQLLAPYSQQITTITYQNNQQLASALLQQQIDVVLAPSGFNWWRIQNALSGFKLSGIVEGSQYDIAMAIRQDWPEFVTLLNRVLATMTVEEHNALINRWLSPQQDQQTLPMHPQLTTVQHHWLTKHPVIRYGVNTQCQPISYYTSTRNPVGIVPDYMQHLQSVLGIRFEPIPVNSWADAIRHLQQGRIDIVPAAPVTPTWENLFQLTQPYLDFPVAIFAPIGQPLIDKIERLYHRTVIVIAGSAPAEWLHTHHPEITLITVANTKLAVKTLASGKADALIGNLFVISQMLVREQLFQIRMAGEIPDHVQLAMAVRPNWHPLVAIIEQALQAIPQKERDAIQSSWMQTLRHDTTNYKLFWQLFSVGCITLILILIWNRRLAHEIKKRQAAEHILKKSEQRYRDMVESAGADFYFYSLAPDGSFLYAGASSRVLFGLDPCFMIGRHWTAIARWNEATRHHLTHALNVCLAGHIPLPVTMTYQLENIPRHLISYPRPVIDNQGQVTRIEGIAINLTERFYLEEALRDLQTDFQALLNHTPLPILIATTYNKILMINRCFNHVIGYTLEQIPDADHWWPLAFPDPDYREYIKTIWKDNISSITTPTALEPLEVRITCSDGQNRIFLIYATVIQHKYLVVFVELTEQRRIEANLRHAQQRAEAANRAKSNFIATISHEIRTPMNAILGMHYLCLETKLTTQQQHYLQQAQQATQTLLRLLNDILDFSKIEANYLELEHAPFTLSVLLQKIADLVSHQVQTKSLTLQINQSPPVPDALVGDALRLEQIVLNLTNNAIKFTDQGSIRIDVSLITKLPHSSNPSCQRAYLKFMVTDTGIGISEGALEHLFQPFQQADSSITRRYGGTGLGLSICKRLVDLMGGTIDVASQVNQGTCFWFQLWFDCPEPQQNNAITAPTTTIDEQRLINADQPTSIRSDTANHRLSSGHSLVQMTDINIPGFDHSILQQRLTAHPHLLLAGMQICYRYYNQKLHSIHDALETQQFSALAEQIHSIIELTQYSGFVHANTVAQQFATILQQANPDIESLTVQYHHLQASLKTIHAALPELGTFNMDIKGRTRDHADEPTERFEQTLLLELLELARLHDPLLEERIVDNEKTLTTLLTATGYQTVLDQAFHYQFNTIKHSLEQLIAVHDDITRF
jgi:signal transduction histidine kinase/ABC-type amino acid transport substrate-binding protein